jgi:hypothetical protein
MKDYEHLDMVGAEIFKGDFVVGSYGNGSGIAIYIVVSVAPRTLSLRKYDVKKPRSHPRRYAQDLVKLNDEQTKELLFNVIRTAG